VNGVWIGLTVVALIAGYVMIYFVIGWIAASTAALDAGTWQSSVRKQASEDRWRLVINLSYACWSVVIGAVAVAFAFTDRAVFPAVVGCVLIPLGIAALVARVRFGTGRFADLRRAFRRSDDRE